MSKRTVTELQSETTGEDHGGKKPFRTETKSSPEDDMGEFEDGWEDEFESDEEVVDGEVGDGECAYTTHIT